MRRTICTTLSLCGRPKEGSRFLDRRVPTRSKPLALAVAAALGAVAPFAVLGNETVTNTGPTVLRGDLGVYDGTAITGFFGTVENDGPGIVIGAIHQTDAVAQQAQSDATTLFNTLMGLPTGSIIPAELGGQTLIGGSL